MIPNDKKMLILETVAKGHTFKHAAEIVEISPTRARQAFSRICREIGVKPDVKSIRENVGDVLEKLRLVADVPANKLSKKLRHNLLSALNLEQAESLTPELVSKIVGAKLLHANGFGPSALVEIQKWLKNHGYALSTKAPTSVEEKRDVEHAVAILEIYGLRVTQA